MKRTIPYIAALLCINIIFIWLLYLSDGVSPQILKNRINEGLRTSNLIDHGYPVFAYDYPSIFMTIGVDHSTDCFIETMALYRSEDRVKNAITPAFARGKKGKDCQTRISIAQGRVTTDDLTVETKPRLWHGAKAILLFSMPLVNHFQLNHLIKLGTYFMYGFIGLMIALLAPRMVWPYLPIMFLGITNSGVVVHGGFTNSLPYLWVLLGLSSLLIARNLKLFWTIPLLSLFMGAVLAFLYITDGSLMLALPLLAFLMFFIVYESECYKERIFKTLNILLFFMGGFIFTLLFKQFITLIYEPDALRVFVETIVHRIRDDDNLGNNITPAYVITRQLDWFHLAVLGWKEYAQLILWLGVWSWVIATLAACYHALNEGYIGPLIELGVFYFGAIVVFSRFLIMGNHSAVHAIVVGRYLFVAISLGVAAMLYFLMSFSKKESFHNDV